MKNIFYYITVLFLLVTTTTYGQYSDYTITRSIHRSKMEEYAPIRVNTDQTYSCQSKEGLFGVKLWYDRKARTTQAEWHYQITVSVAEVRYYDGRAYYTSITEDKILRIDEIREENLQTYIHHHLFDKDKDGNDFDIKDHQNAVIYIRSIDKSNNAPDDIYLDMEYYRDGKEELAMNYNLKFGGSATNSIQNEQLQLFWDYLPGAEEYDLEWVFIDAKSNLALSNPDVTPQEAFEYQEPTRITTSDQHFVLEMNYTQGKVYFRVRGVGHYENYPDQPRYASWQYGQENPVTYEIIGDYQNENYEYEKDKIWQSVTTYAEEGKYKKVVSYLDGSMRSRQVVTHLNTDNLALVAETRYDYEGRGVLQILPVPLAAESTDSYQSFERVASLHYRKGLNKMVVTEPTETGYEKYLYDNEQTSLARLSTNGGTGKYYSPNNDLETIHRDYLPNADGYAFTQVVYDNEGRVKSQGGVGELFQYDTDGEDRRSTDYFYANTNETELRRMFGKNVGKASHYRKQAVRDANGQVSVSYMDQAGNVIATALAGESPEMLLALDKDTDEQLSSINVSLNDNNRIDLENHTSTSTNEILNVTPNTNYTITYGMTGAKASFEDWCKTCKYELNVYIYTPSEERIELVEKQEIGGLECPTIGQFDFQKEVLFKEIGVYTLVKELKIKEESVAEIRTQIEGSGRFKDEADLIITKYLSQIDYTNCDICIGDNCVDGVTNIEDWATEIQQLRCENISAQINYEEQQGKFPIGQHPERCHLKDCNDNFESNRYTQMMSTVSEWGDAITSGTAVYTGYARPINIDLPGVPAPTTNHIYDPYFTTAPAYGVGRVDEMIALLSNVGTDVQGNTLNAWQAAEKIATEQAPILGKPEEELRWKFFYGFYIQAKNTLHRDILNSPDRQCFYAAYIDDNGETVEIPDPIVIDPVLPITPQERDIFFDDNFPPLNCQQQVAAWIEQIKALCYTLTDAQLASIQENLEAYCAITNDGGNAYGFLYYEECDDPIGRSTATSNKINPIIAQNLKTDKQTQELIKSIQTDKEKLDLQKGGLDPLGGGGIKPIDPEPTIGTGIGTSTDCICRMKRSETPILYEDAKACLLAQADYINPTFIISCLDDIKYLDAQGQEVIDFAEFEPCIGTEFCGSTPPPPTKPACVCQLIEQYNGIVPAEQLRECMINNRNDFTRYYGYTAYFAVFECLDNLTPDPITGINLVNITQLQSCANINFGCNIPKQPDCLCELTEQYYGMIPIELAEECFERNTAYFNQVYGWNGSLYQYIKNCHRSIVPILQNGILNISALEQCLNTSFGCIPPPPPSCICELYRKRYVTQEEITECYINNEGYFTSLGVLKKKFKQCLEDIIPNSDELYDMLAIEQCLQISIDCPVTPPTKPDCLCQLYAQGEVTPAQMEACYNANQDYFHNLAGSQEEYETCYRRAKMNSETFGMVNMNDLQECLGFTCQEPKSLCDLGYAGTVAEIKAILGYTQRPNDTDQSDYAKIARCVWYVDDAQEVTLEQLEECAGVVLDCPQGTGCNTEGNIYLDNIKAILTNASCEVAFDQIIVDNPCKRYITHEKTIQKQYSVLKQPTYANGIDRGSSIQVSNDEHKYNAFGQGDFTLEAYVTLNQPQGTAIGVNYNIMYMFNRESVGVGSYVEKAIFWNVNGETRQVNFWFPGGRIYTTSTLNTGECTHISVVRKDGDINIYFNGVLQNTVFTWFADQEELNEAINFSTTKTRAINIATHSFFGTVQHAGQHFPGIVREVRMWKEARVPTQFSSPDELVINNPTTLPNLLGYWKINEGSGNIIQDYSANPLSASTNLTPLPISAKWEEPTECGITGEYTQIVRICAEYDQDVLDDIFPQMPSLDDLIAKCKEELEVIARIEAQDSITRLLDKYQEELLQEYYANCFNITEDLEYEYTPSEYHYTLFYYDQAGSLVQTVPPKGVQLLTVAQTQAGNINPAHRMRTRYRYNSLGQVRWQDSPDKGVLQLFYDDLGYNVLTQNAEQAINEEYSYTLRDYQGREVEVGQVTTNKTSNQIVEDIHNDNLITSNEYQKEQVIRTFYDFAPNLDNININQTYLRGRASAIFVEGEEQKVESRSLYSYDIHGNVQQVWQELPDLQDIKTTTYDYNLVSGVTNEVIYQKGKDDEFSHRYYYDADNRITSVETSHDGYIWDEDVKYHYYAHGPVARTEMGEYKVQATDDFYKLNGSIKGANMYDIDKPQYEYISSKVGRLEYHFYDKDYISISGHVSSNPSSYNLYNSNISAATIDLVKLGSRTQLYRYDQLNRIKESTNATGTGLSYKETFDYDANGNIVAATLHNKAGTLVDNAIYHYQQPFSNNKLAYIDDTQTEYHKGFDLKDQDEGNFSYNAIGNLIKDVSGGIDNIEWSIYQKRRVVKKADDTEVEYKYDAANRRIYKKVTDPQGEVKITHYVRGSSGDVIAIYEDLEVSEYNITGMMSLGTYNGKTEKGKQTLGNKKYQFINYTENVIALYSDNKYGEDTNSDAKADIYISYILIQKDYLCFGAEMYERSFGDVEYRYTFNGKEMDKSTGWQDYGMRDYNPVYKRFDRVDPIASQYPELSTYQFASNSPIIGIDLDGLELLPNTLREVKSGDPTKRLYRITYRFRYDEGYTHAAEEALWEFSRISNGTTRSSTWQEIRDASMNSHALPQRGNMPDGEWNDKYNRIYNENPNIVEGTEVTVFVEIPKSTPPVTAGDITPVEKTPSQPPTIHGIAFATEGGGQLDLLVVQAKITFGVKATGYTDFNGTNGGVLEASGDASFTMGFGNWTASSARFFEDLQNKDWSKLVDTDLTLKASYVKDPGRTLEQERTNYWFNDKSNKGSALIGIKNLWGPGPGTIGIQGEYDYDKKRTEAGIFWQPFNNKLFTSDVLPGIKSYQKKSQLNTERERDHGD